MNTEQREILIVEDDIGIVDLFSEILTENGYNVSSVRNSNDAIQYLEKNSPDLVILDYSLPDMNGKELIEELCRRKLALPPFIVSTGQGDENVAVNMMKCGASDYIVKDSRLLERIPEIVKRIFNEIENEKKRKQAEEDLIHHQYYLKKAQEIGKIGAWELDMVNNILTWTEETYKMFGISKGQDINFENFIECVYPDDRDYVTRKWGAALKGELYDIEHRIKVNQKIKWVREKAEVDFNNDGKAIRAIGFVQDITDRKRAEEALRRSEAKQRSMISNISDVIAIMDKSGVIQYKSPNVKKHFGWGHKELIGKDGWSTVHPDDLKFVQKEFFQLLKEPNLTATIEYRYKCKDSTYRMIQLTAINLVHNPDVEGILLNYHDISERKKTEKALRDSEERFKALHNASFGGITIHDKGIILDCNHGLTEITGYSCQELIGMDGLLLISEEYREMVMDKIQVGYEKPYEAVGIRKDREKYPVRLEARNIPYKGKEVRVLEFRDITQQKQAELEIKQKNEEYQAINKELEESLEHIQKINAELEEAMRKAEESDKLKTAFLANMSHEIRTPMNGIMGFADLLKSPNLTGQRQKLYVDVIQKSSERMLSIINDLIDISIIEAGQAEIHTEKIQVNAIIDDLFLFFKPQVKDKGLQLSCHKGLNDEQSNVNIDKNKIAQVLSNLINNALKFTSSGQIKYGYIKKNSVLEFFVKDTGIGIHPEMKEKIFDRFRQVDTSMSRKYEGSGLGLSISKAFVEMHGGKIWVESVPERGSSFYFTIPYRDVGSEAIEFEKEKPEPEILLAGRVKVLIAEDDEISSLFLQEILKEKNFELIIAKDGKEAVEAVNNDPDIAIILMDIKMPIMNGLEASSEIKRKYPKIPIIAQTAFAQVRDQHKALEAGCDSYITKPVQADLLFDILSKFLK